MYLHARRAAKQIAGGYVGGRPALGFEAFRGALRVSANEAVVVAFVFERVIEGWSIRAITRALDESHTLGRRWHPSTIAAALHRADAYKSAGIIDARTRNQTRAVLATRRRG